jgi:hypothetical protein
MSNNNPTYREEIAPEVAYLQNVQTPLLSTLGRESVQNQYYENVMGRIPDDSWDTTDTLTAKKEATSWVAQNNNTTEYRIRAGNYTSIQDARFFVSDSERGQDEVGVGDEYDQRSWEKLIGLTKFWEAHLVWSRSATHTVVPNNKPGEVMFQSSPYEPDGSTGDARTTHGIMAYAFDLGRTPTSDVAINGSVIPGDTSALIRDGFTSTYYDGSSTDITRENLIEKIVQPYWEKGGQSSHALTFVGSSVKNVMDKFGTIYSGSGSTLTASHLNERNVAAELHHLHDMVDIFTFTWGDLYVIKSHLFANPGTYANYGNSGVSITPSKSMLMFEPRYVKLAVRRAMKTIHLPKTGDFSAGVHVGEMGIQVLNPRALALGVNIAA